LGAVGRSRRSGTRSRWSWAMHPRTCQRVPAERSCRGGSKEDPSRKERTPRKITPPQRPRERRTPASSRRETLEQSHASHERLGICRFGRTHTTTQHNFSPPSHTPMTAHTTPIRLASVWGPASPNDVHLYMVTEWQRTPGTGARIVTTMYSLKEAGKEQFVKASHRPVAPPISVDVLYMGIVRGRQ